MNLRKPLSALLALTMLTGVVGCGSKKEFNYSDGLDDKGFFKGVKATDYVTLPEYKGIELDKAILVASDEAVDEQLVGVLEGFGTYEELTTGTIKDGDTVNIDYVGSVDGVEFEGGNTNGSGTTVTIGVTSYIDDFLEQLIGHKPGDTFDVEVTFPDPYEGNTDLSGKDAVFKTTINYIQGEYSVPEMSDDIAASYGFESSELMIEDIERWIISRQKFEAFNEILEKATVNEIPQVVLDYVINYDVYEIENTAKMYGTTADEFLQQAYGIESLEAYKEQNAEVYRDNAAKYLTAQAIAELEADNVKVTDADIEASGYSAWIDSYGKPYVTQYVLFQTILPEFIVSNANLK